MDANQWVQWIFSNLKDEGDNVKVCKICDYAWLKPSNMQLAEHFEQPDHAPAVNRKERTGKDVLTNWMSPWNMGEEDGRCKPCKRGDHCGSKDCPCGCELMEPEGYVKGHSDPTYTDRSLEEEIVDVSQLTDKDRIEFKEWMEDKEVLNMASRDPKFKFRVQDLMEQGIEIDDAIVGAALEFWMQMREYKEEAQNYCNCPNPEWVQYFTGEDGFKYYKCKNCNHSPPINIARRLGKSKSEGRWDDKEKDLEHNWDVLNTERKDRIKGFIRDIETFEEEILTKGLENNALTTEEADKILEYLVKAKEYALAGDMENAVIQTNAMGDYWNIVHPELLRKEETSEYDKGYAEGYNVGYSAGEIDGYYAGQRGEWRGTMGAPNTATHGKP